MILETEPSASFLTPFLHQELLLGSKNPINRAQHCFSKSRMFVHSSLVLSRESPAKSGLVFQCFKGGGGGGGGRPSFDKEFCQLLNGRTSHWLILIWSGEGGGRAVREPRGRGECRSGCGKFSQLALSLPDCRFDGWGRKGFQLGFLSLDTESLLLCLVGSSRFPNS